MLTDVWHDHQKIRFLVVGAWNTAFAYLAFGVAYVLLHEEVHYLLICVFAHMLSVTNAFVCQRRFVFRSTTRWWPAFLRFNLVQVIVLAWGLAGLALTVEILHLNPLVGQFLVMTIAVIASYMLNRVYSFQL